jgi:ribosomal protein S18 acetylase RimI-like enzyme
MKEAIIYREIKAGEEDKVCQLVMDCFNEFISPGYSKEGITEFSKYVNPQLMKHRLAKNHFIILALDNREIIGVVEVRNNNHISLYFVKKQYQNKGIGKKLNELAINKCMKAKPDVTTIEVHASPYAVPVYEKLGFVKVDTERIENGIRFTPMIIKLK